MSNQLRHKFIVSLDPSGAYEEGKGTTGWCVFNAADNKIYNAGALYAINYPTWFGYYDAHIAFLRKWHERYGDQMCVVIEDYRVYANKAKYHVHSRMETCKLIGIIQYFCEANHIPFYLQLAILVKNRWSNKILLHKEYIVTYKNKLMLPDKKTPVNKHTLDSIRHAVHFATFENYVLQHLKIKEE